MAERLITKINRYLGTAAEMAAMDTTGVPAGSTFFTSDEGLLYMLDSAGNWVLKVGKSIPVDANGDEKFTDANPATVKFPGSALQEERTEADADENGVVAFSENISVIEIVNNDKTNEGVFTVNGIPITLPPSTDYFLSRWKDGVGGTPGKTVTVAGSTSYILHIFI